MPTSREIKSLRPQCADRGSKKHLKYCFPHLDSKFEENQAQTERKYFYRDLCNVNQTVKTKAIKIHKNRRKGLHPLKYLCHRQVIIFLK